MDRGTRQATDAQRAGRQTARAVWLPLVLAVSGPGVLAVLWATRSWPKDERGFTSFRSGTVGDALLLPMTVFSLQLILDKCSRARGERRWAIAATAMGSTGGAAVQWVWWSDPNPPRQWGLSAPHSFSVAGAWHAAFFVAVSGLLCGLWAQCLFRVRKEPVPARARRAVTSPPVTALVVALFTFAGLVSLDSSSSTGSASTLSSLGGLGVSLAFLVISAGFALKGRARPSIPAVLLGAATSVIAVWLLATWPPAPVSLSGFVLLVIGVPTLRAGLESCRTRSGRLMPPDRPLPRDATGP